MIPIHQETIRFERFFSVSPQRLFAAYIDPRERERWSAPSDTAAVRIENSDVRTGGTETTRCGAKDDLRYRTQVYYHLVEADRLISFSETLLDGESVLMAALITFEFHAVGGGGTRLVLSDQITSFVGPEGVEGHRLGFSSVLDNLQRRLEG